MTTYSPRRRGGSKDGTIKLNAARMTSSRAVLMSHALHRASSFHGFIRRVLARYTIATTKAASFMRSRGEKSISCHRALERFFTTVSKTLDRIRRLISGSLSFEKASALSCDPREGEFGPLQLNSSPSESASSDISSEHSDKTASAIASDGSGPSAYLDDSITTFESNTVRRTLLLALASSRLAAASMSPDMMNKDAHPDRAKLAVPTKIILFTGRTLHNHHFERQGKKCGILPTEALT